MLQDLFTCVTLFMDPLVALSRDEKQLILTGHEIQVCICKLGFAFTFLIFFAGILCDYDYVCFFWVCALFCYFIWVLAACLYRLGDVF
jgi:hypothetical protein